MRRSLHTAHVYMILGLVSGLFYREFTKLNDFTGESQLSVVHTHLLALGMLVFLIVLGLDKVFGLSGMKSFNVFYWLYNTGMVITVGSMVFRGVQTVLGNEIPEVFAFLSGAGHIVLTIGLIAFFGALGKRVKKPTADTPAESS
ncbi:DUF2871 domain-containing protein [Phytomonospora endophytica]|uniref:DUF2871 domain-containing protein n=1 Tax=Phytomonospora endophytica TaxID=714109 RepID=A0A841FZM3_9ACTN|nr:DUF2871 domain-containing protein [Phytomonospora endophytica]MBB6038837.1 hypothetical protein [Phytomonospora endophytica]GIG68368.1 hypothetical protein Pen01_46630 [Phytomonospora endophytica]